MFKIAFVSCSLFVLFLLFSSMWRVSGTFLDVMGKSLISILSIVGMFLLMIICSGLWPLLLQVLLYVAMMQMQETIMKFTVLLVPPALAIYIATASLLSAMIPGIPIVGIICRFLNRLEMVTKAGGE